MRHLPSLAAILVACFVFAILITPADPVSMLLALTALVVVASLGYGLGVRSGSRALRVRGDRPISE